MMRSGKAAQRPLCSFKAHSSGFTLAEMAIVLVIMGLVILTVFPALTSLRQSGQQALTQSNLRSLMTATAAFVQSNGCLPCPAIPGGTKANFGKVSTSTNSGCGACTAAQGIPPFASLGVPPSTARDGWGHWITMRVDTGLTNPTPTVVPPTAPCTEADVTSGYCISSQIGFAVKGLCKKGTASSTVKVTTIMPSEKGATQNAAVIFVSHGQAGYGSYAATPAKNGNPLPFPSNYLECSAYGGFARCNANDDVQFYDAPIVIGDTDPYDDVLAYADRNTLVSMLGSGACASTWGGTP
ncbi:MAG: type II secretion system protein [Bdellovibrionales bacterium]